MERHIKSAKLLLGISLLMVLVSGCAFWPNEGPLQYVNDQKLNRQVKKAVEVAAPGDAANLRITTFDRYVKFAGRFSTAEVRDRTLEAVRRITGVREVLDYTTVGSGYTIPPSGRVPQVSSAQ